LVINNFLRTTWLWERVRVQGGAYGGSCSFDRRSGVFNFLSYRDPNLLATLENYDRASHFLRKVDLSQDELTKSIIGVIGDLDAYQLPDTKGYTSMARYLAGDTDAERQRMRDEVLSTIRECVLSPDTRTGFPAAPESSPAIGSPRCSSHPAPPIPAPRLAAGISSLR
jgi:hypothetical protein